MSSKSAKPETSPLDEVDTIIAAWQNARPDLDFTPMQVFSRLTRVARQFDLRRRQVFAHLNLEAWEFDVLSSLRRGGQQHPLTPGKLMEELLVTSGTMTNRIDRLEAKGLVARTPSDKDRRTIFVTLTRAGITKADTAMTELLAVEHEILKDMPQGVRAEFSAQLRHLAGTL